ncbi:MAG TPA: 6-bladed beta-propeller [Longimicrobium sp.]|nr:6-bladed beta-propeller [Longimicrobium sp.]
MITHPVRRALLAAVVASTAPLVASAQQVVRLPEQDRPLAGRLGTVFSVGAMEGQSWEMLSSAEQAVFDRADNLYVLDRGNARVLMFDRAGRFVRQMGRKGGGPGELQVPVAMAVLPDGSVGVYDLAHANLSLFGANGRFARTVPWNESWGFPMRQMMADPRGGVVAMLRPRLNPEALRAGAPPRQTQSLSRVALAGNGTATKLLEIPDPAVTRTSGGDAPGGGRTVNFRMMGPPEFSPLTLWGVLPGGGVALTHTQLYTVKVYDANGRPVRYLQRPVRVRRPTERDRQRAREAMRERMQSGRGVITMTQTVGPGGATRTGAGGGRGMNPEQIEQRVREMQFADTVRSIQGMTVTPGGKLWIERTPANIGTPGPIDIVTADGRYLGTVSGIKLPISISATGRAAYLERDEDDVERIVVRQLPAGWF